MFFLFQAGIRGTRIRNPGMCESVHSYGLDDAQNQIPIGRVEALAMAHTFVSEIDDIMYIRPVETQHNGRLNGGTTTSSSAESKSGAGGSSKRKADSMSGGGGGGGGGSNDDLLATSRKLHPSVINLDILATQHRTPPSLFLCLTTKSLVRYVQLQPVDQLYRLFCTQVDVYGDQVDQFRQLYGTAECCSMCLSIVCAPIAARGARWMTSQTGGYRVDGDDDVPRDGRGDSELAVAGEPQAIRRAEMEFIELGKQVRQQAFNVRQLAGGVGGGNGGNGNGGRSNNSGLPGSPALGVNLGRQSTYSERYVGMKRFFSRIVRPLWKWSVTVSELKTDGSPERFGLPGVLDVVSNKIQKIGAKTTGKKF